MDALYVHEFNYKLLYLVEKLMEKIFCTFYFILQFDLYNFNLNQLH